MKRKLCVMLLLVAPYLMESTELIDYSGDNYTAKDYELFAIGRIT